MKKLLLIGLFVLTACGTTPAASTPTPVMNQYPTPMPTPTLAALTRPIEGDEQEEALNFFYELKLHMAGGEFEHFAEEIRYPITVAVDGQPKSFVYAAELEANFEKIFSADQIRRFAAIDESELSFTPEGVKVADGIIWFDLVCQDPGCATAEFRITRIGN